MSSKKQKQNKKKQKTRHVICNRVHKGSSMNDNGITLMKQKYVD
jgi:hypothetical protein